MIEAVAFIHSDQGAIDRGWDTTSVSRVLLELGLRTSAIYSSDEKSLRRGLADASPNVLAWPACYTVGQDVAGPLLVDVLEALHIPYVGPSSQSLFLNSKIELNNALGHTDFTIPEYELLDGEAVRTLGLQFPCMFKTEFTCNSEGVRYVHTAEDAERVFRELERAYSQRIIAEAWERATEYTIAYLPARQTAFVAAIEMTTRTGKQFVDREAKRDNRYLKFRVPGSPTHELLVEQARQLAARFNIDGHFRLDVVENDSGDLFIIDLNFLPGMNDTKGQWSYFPLALHLDRGLAFREIVCHMLAHAVHRAEDTLPAWIEKSIAGAVSHP